MAKTIDQIKEMRIEVESKILELLQKFEKDSGILIGYIGTERVRPKNTRDGYHPCQCMPEESYNGPLANVEINIRFEL